MMMMIIRHTYNFTNSLSVSQATLNNRSQQWTRTLHAVPRHCWFGQDRNDIWSVKCSVPINNS